MTTRCARALANRTSDAPGRESGFSLLEIIIVLGILGAIAGILLPRMSPTQGSQMARSLREFSSTLRSAYDNAILTGRIHRIVIQQKKGTYWPEVAPESFTGRPAPDVASDDLKGSSKADDRKRYLDDLEKEASDKRKAGQTGDREYTVRSILVQQRYMLSPVKWTEVDDPVLFRGQLPSGVAFASIFVENMDEKADYAKASDDDKFYLYFFPSGQTLQASIYIGTLTSDNQIAETGPRYTLELDPLSGQSELLEGFQDADWVKTKIK